MQHIGSHIEFLEKRGILHIQKAQDTLCCELRVLCQVFGRYCEHGSVSSDMIQSTMPAKQCSQLIINDMPPKKSEKEYKNV